MTTFSLDDKFQAAVNLIRSLPKEGPLEISIETQLEFYSLFKIATEGPNTKPKPSLWHPIERQKWYAWTNQPIQNPEKAKKQYVYNIGDYLRNLYKQGHSVDMIEQTDMSFLRTLSEKDIMALSEEIEKYKDEEPELIALFNDLKIQFDNGLI